jgi:preprotein translocase subunit SecY
MDYRGLLESVVSRVPTVSQPDGYVSFKQKLKWTAAVLLVYIIMTNIPPFGLAESGGQDFFGQFRSILAGSQGTILQLGIGPIVTASIVMQMVSGIGVIPLDTNDPRDQRLFQGIRRILVIVMVVLTATPIVFLGSFLPPSAQLANSLGIGILGVQLLVFVQIALGGILIFYLDQVVSKWGVGSGIGLFIVAGVSQRIAGGILSPTNGFISNWISIISGDVAISFSLESAQILLIGTGQLIPLFTTVLIFTIVVYCESTKVEVPVTNAQISTRNSYPIKLIYASVLPLILVRAIQANITFIGRGLNNAFSNLPSWVGVYNANGQPVSGLFYYLSPIQSPQQWMWWLGGTTAEPWQILIRVSVDALILIIGGAVFAVFWTRTADMDAKSKAQKIYNSGLEIPGHRRTPRRIKVVLQRYIPYITVIGGAIVGFLAISANLLGTLGNVTGTGLLLSVSITYKIYQQIGKEKVKEANQMLRQFF